MKGEIAAKQPIAIDVEAGESYAWCTCGKSSGQPFCDGSHKGTDFTPLMVKAEESKTIYFCQCKQTENAFGFCDGRHKEL